MASCNQGCSVDNSVKVFDDKESTSVGRPSSLDVAEAIHVAVLLVHLKTAISPNLINNWYKV